MADTGADAAQRYREHMREKASRLGEGEDARKVDASDFEPAEKLYAGVKTGMRPVSRQARKRGGAVHGEESPLGEHALQRPGRAPRKAGGGVGESYVNRDQKAANAEREGEYPNGGMKKGGRAHRDGGGGLFGGYDQSGTAGEPAGIANDPKDQQKVKAHGGRAHRAEGGYIPREGGPSETRELRQKTASGKIERNGRPAAEDGRQGRASGGRVARQAGGPLATPLAAGMGGQGRFNFNYGPQQSTASKLGFKDGGRTKAHERYGHGPSCSCPSCRKGKAIGGGFGALGGLLPLAIDQLSGDDGDNKPAPYSPNTGKRHGGRAKRADGGEVAAGALKQHKLEHKALGKARGGGFRTASGGVSAAGRAKAEAKGETMPGGGFPIRNKADLANAKQSVGRAKRPEAARRWIDKRAKELGAPGLGKAKGGSISDAHRVPAYDSLKKEYLSQGYPEATAHRSALAGAKSMNESQLAKHAAGVPYPQFMMDDEKAKGGRAGRARGGKSGKGKMNVNIVIAPGGANPQPAGPPGANPALGIRPPPAAPVPMPPPGGAPPPGAAAPMPMPIPVPMGGAPGAGMPPPGMMPPRARGGRAPSAGSGSGLGRLKKIEEYGHRSKEGAGLRK